MRSNCSAIVLSCNMIYFLLFFCILFRPIAFQASISLTVIVIVLIVLQKSLFSVVPSILFTQVKYNEVLLCIHRC